MERSLLAVLILRICLAVVAQEVAYNPGNIGLDSSGGYRGLLVAIDPSVSYKPVILHNVKEYLREMSYSLLKATSKESSRYLQEVTILLPGTWPPDPTCRSLSSETQNSANILVQPDTDLWGSAPHSLRYDSQCGRPGFAMVLPESYVADRNTARKHGSNIGSLLLKQWAIYRYGVFDESSSNDSSCLWFEGDAVFPIKCSNDIEGETEIPEEGGSCRFVPHSSQPAHVKASVLYQHDLHAVDEFCDEQGRGIKHNFAVPNEHNDRCGGRSVWEVLRSHVDFHLRYKRQSSGVQRRAINFHCVQESTPPRMVLTMDVSGSMDDEGRLERMRTDVRLFIKSISCQETSIGMVQFSSNFSETHIRHSLVRLDSETNVLSLISAIPSRTLERSCIGCGIIRAIEVLQASGSTNGGVIVVFSDGLENQAPFVENVTSRVLQAGIVVYAILLSSIAENHSLQVLARRTGGKSCTYYDNQYSTYYDCLTSILQDRSPTTAPIQVLNSIINVPPNRHVIDTVNIDSDLTRNLQMVITWDEKNNAACRTIDIVLISPIDIQIGSGSETYEKNLQLRSISIDLSSVQQGLWAYMISNSHSLYWCEVRVLLEGKVDNSDGCGQTQPSSPYVGVSTQVQPSQLSVTPENLPHENAIRIYARVQRGFYPVIMSEVVATLKTPTNREITLQLFDNGAGADFSANDGIYSRYFIDYDNSGVYDAKFNVLGTNATRQVFTKGAYGRSASRYLQDSTQNLSVLEPFQRYTPSKSFQIHQHELSITSKSSLFPPSTITDLRLLDLDTLNLEVELSWTASGQHLDQGRAWYYELRVSSNVRMFHQNFRNTSLVSEEMLVFGQFYPPGEFGAVERIRINFTNSSFVPDRNTAYYFSVKAVNNYGRASEPSNSVLVMFSLPKDRRASTTKGSEILGLPSVFFYLLLALVLFVLLISLIVIASVIYLVRKRRSSSEAGKDLEKSTSQNSNDDVTTVVAGQAASVSGAALATSMESRKAHTDGTIGSKKSKKSSKRTKLSNKIRRSQGLFAYFSSISSKKSTQSKNKRHKLENSPAGKPWVPPDEPLQNHNYSNRLFGEAALSPEVEIKNSVIFTENKTLDPFTKSEP